MWQIHVYGTISIWNCSFNIPLNKQPITKRACLLTWRIHMHISKQSCWIIVNIVKHYKKCLHLLFRQDMEFRKSWLYFKSPITLNFWRSTIFDLGRTFTLVSFFNTEYWNKICWMQIHKIVICKIVASWIVLFNRFWNQ